MCRMVIRKIKNYWLTAFCVITTSLAVIMLINILDILITKGSVDFGLALFTQPTPAPMASGGLSNAIIGSVMISFCAIIISIPIGILIATYVVEFGHKSRLTRLVRFANDILRK